MPRFIIAAVALLLSATEIHAQITPLSVTCGTDWDGSPKRFVVSKPGDYALTVPPWMLCDAPNGVVGATPVTVACRCDKARAPFVNGKRDSVELGFPCSIAFGDGVTIALTCLASCGTSSACQQGAPLPVPTAKPTATAPVRTATPLPGATQTPVRTITPLPTKTAQPGETAETAVPTRTVVPTKTVTPTSSAPQSQPTAAPSGYVARPMRPSGLDVSFRVLDEGYPFRWCPLRPPGGGTFFGYVPCTQVGMDAMTETSLVYVVNLVRLVRAITNGWAAVADFMLSDSQGASAITAFLNPIYEGNFGEYKGDWAEDETGKDYRKPFYALRKARGFLLGNPTACAAAFPATWPKAEDQARYLDVLNLTIANGRCVGTPWAPSYPSAKIPPHVQALGTIVYGVTQPPLTEHQRHLLHETHRVHQAVSDWRCGVGPEQPAGAVGAAHVAFEASARNEAELHRFGLKAFSGEEDGRYSRAELCKWARLQDAKHEAWMTAVEAGDWAASRKAETSHQVAHLCMNLRDDRLLVRMPDCGAANASACPIETCAQILGRL